MKLNFTSLLYFQRTAEMQHLTNAAESLHVAQPALSRMISGIEKEWVSHCLNGKEGILN